jgi:hypothetical protein
VVNGEEMVRGEDEVEGAVDEVEIGEVSSVPLVLRYISLILDTVFNEGRAQAVV